jgi:hypothetical protein
MTERTKRREPTQWGRGAFAFADFPSFLPFYCVPCNFSRIMLFAGFQFLFLAFAPAPLYNT